MLIFAFRYRSVFDTCLAMGAPCNKSGKNKNIAFKWILSELVWAATLHILIIFHCLYRYRHLQCWVTEMWVIVSCVLPIMGWIYMYGCLHACYPDQVKQLMDGWMDRWMCMLWALQGPAFLCTTMISLPVFCRNPPLVYFAHCLQFRA